MCFYDSLKSFGEHNLRERVTCGSCVYLTCLKMIAYSFSHLLYFEDCDSFLDGRCYKAYHDSMTWQDARDKCNCDGGDLVTVCNEETNDMLKQIMQAQV